MHMLAMALRSMKRIGVQRLIHEVDENAAAAPALADILGPRHGQKAINIYQIYSRAAGGM